MKGGVLTYAHTCTRAHAPAHMRTRTHPRRRARASRIPRAPPSTKPPLETGQRKTAQATRATMPPKRAKKATKAGYCRWQYQHRTKGKKRLKTRIIKTA